jgi:hypothetical protein
MTRVGANIAMRDDTHVFIAKPLKGWFCNSGTDKVAAGLGDFCWDGQRSALGVGRCIAARRLLGLLAAHH